MNYVKMSCKSCGKNDHQRKSSRSCKFYKPRPNNVKPNDNDKFIFLYILKNQILFFQTRFQYFYQRQK